MNCRMGSAGAFGAPGAGGNTRPFTGGYQAVYDADLKGYFDRSHSQLLACCAFGSWTVRF